MAIERVNVRVYGLLVHNGHVLVADELIRGRRITKFPGGGLEPGEGTRTTLFREIGEELDVDALDIQHYYTTDYFQISAFDATQQIISIYYTFNVADPTALRTSTKPFDFKQDVRNEESFRWLDLSKATIEDATLPIDRVVLGMLIAKR